MHRQNVDSTDQRLAVISHELRNSLGTVHNAARLLKLRAEATPAIVERARLLIERQVAQMSRLIEDIRDVSRFSSGLPGLNRERMDLRVPVTYAIEGIAPEMVRRGHRVSVALPAEPVWLDGDIGRLEQVFANLLINAAKYTHDGGRIMLTMARQKNGARVRIRDTGIGIAPQVLPHVFGLFVQGDPFAARSVSGFGIGLAVVRSFVEKHGGRVTAASRGVGRGSDFTVHLPTSPSAPSGEA